MILPCKHQKVVTAQVKPAIDLLTNLDQWHPDVLRSHEIEPLDYHNGLVFRSAIESIRGTYIASSTTGREAIVKDVLEHLTQPKQIRDYKHKWQQSEVRFRNSHCPES